MENTDQIKMLLSLFATQAPILIVSLVAIVVILARWKQAPRASLYALLAFGLSLILCIAMPIAQTAVQSWATRSSVAMTERASVFAGLGFAWSILRATTYALLLVAVFAGRSR